MNPETTQSTGFYEVLAWLEQNKKNVLVGFSAVVIIGCAIAGYRWKSHQTELSASEALLQLRASLNPTDKTASPEASAYLKVASDYPSTDAAERASLLAAGALFNEGKYAEAVAQFDKFLQKHGSHALAATAAFGRAASIEGQGKLDEALSAYQSVLSQYPKSATVNATKLAIARIYEVKNQPQQALSVYDELARPNAATSGSSEAMRRKEFLLAKFPDLAKTNAPAAQAIPATSPIQGSVTNLPSATTSPAPAKP
jgi:outer membrane protein assembly factor BamD (BamD/ComL family)